MHASVAFPSATAYGACVRRNLIEQAVALCLVDVNLPPLMVDSAGVTHGLVQRPLLIHDARILREHGRDGLLVRLLTGDLVLREPPLMLQELQVVPLLLLQHLKREDRRRLLLGLHVYHDDIVVRLRLS